MSMSVKNLIRTEINVHHAHSYFSTANLTNFFYSCGVVNFNDNQLKELKRLHEFPQIRKLKLGDKFPRKVLCMKILAL